MKNPVDRAGCPLTTPKPKAWMSHTKTKNGYIVRLSLFNGYKAYRAHPVENCYHRLPSIIEQTDPRQVEVREDYDNCFCDRSFITSYERSAAGLPRRVSSLVSAGDDPVADGRQLAECDGVGKLGEGKVNIGRSVKVSGDAEEKELADLRRSGLLYDDDAEENVELGLGGIVRERPAFTVKYVARKGVKQKGVLDGRNEQLTVEEEERDEVGQEVGEAADTLFVPKSDLESWLDFAQKSGFDVVMVDDLVSNAESWVEVDG